MALRDVLVQQDTDALGRSLHAFASQLFPICRSITGEGIRQTLDMIAARIPLVLTDVPTGTRVFDWIVPKEWNIRDAYIKDSKGRRVVDFQRSNLHVVNYSVPVQSKMRLADLKPHLFTIPEHPDWIPYRTSYYKEDWGFCLSHNQLSALQDDEYEIVIDSSLEDGNLRYGEAYLQGETDDEILISCHACHPSLANDNLSGITIATHLHKLLSECGRRYSYRFLFIPGTIGAIAWLSRNCERVSRIRHGLVLTCLGDSGAVHYKKSRRGDADIDRAAAHVLKHAGAGSELLDFSPYGYDERQYCSPGFNLAVGCLMRSVWGTFSEYHTSADNLDFIRPESLAQSLHICASIIDVLERNRVYRNLNPFCEPQLGRRNLYGSSGAHKINDEINARLWVLNFSDGEHSLLDIAERAGLPFALIADSAELLHAAGLLTRA